MTNKLSPQPWMIAPETQKIMSVLTADGGDARFVGGCVRNALVNRPVMDIDIATPLLPDDVVARLEKNKIPYAKTGFGHGTLTAVVDGKPFEITTLREDIHTYGRRADVKYTLDWRKDAARRDFTINAIYSTVDGGLYDPMGGIADLRQGRVVFVGNPAERIREDILRILRFFRFYAHFGEGEPDTASLKACVAAAPEIKKLSGERIRQETLKLLTAKKVADVWSLMIQYRVATHFLPEATNVQALRRLVALAGEYPMAEAALLRLAALLDLTAEGLKHVVKSLRLSNDQGVALTRFLFPSVGILTEMSIEELRRAVYRLGNETVQALLLMAVAKGGAEKNLSALYAEAQSFRAPVFPLSGEDAIAAGYPAGPDVGRVLKMVEEWWLAENFMPVRAVCLEKLRLIKA